MPGARRRHTSVAGSTLELQPGMAMRAGAGLLVTAHAGLAECGASQQPAMNQCMCKWGVDVPSAACICG